MLLLLARCHEYSWYQLLTTYLSQLLLGVFTSFLHHSLFLHSFTPRPTQPHPQSYPHPNGQAYNPLPQRQPWRPFLSSQWLPRLDTPQVRRRSVCFSLIYYRPLISPHSAVRTEIEQDGKHLSAKDITVFVRCYEFRHGRLGGAQSKILVEHSVTLWRKPDGQDWAEIGNVEHPFRLTIPVHNAGPSSALYFQEYRICWRIEAGMSCQAFNNSCLMSFSCQSRSRSGHRFSLA
jgi:hypothetical protein